MRLVSDSAPETNDPLDIDAVLAGDPKAFEQLVRQESGRLYRVILRILHDEDEAQSVLQETFLQAYKRLDTFRRESKLTTWLYAIGINQARSARRKNKRLKSYSDEDIERMQPSFSNGWHTDDYERWNPHRAAERSERKRLVHEAIAKLPDAYREVITLRDIEELSNDEVAEILSISNGAVRVRVHRARQALRKLLDGYLNA